MSSSRSIEIIPRRNSERGHADHGWLKTFHTFSFASYHDEGHESFGSLRVLNEDRVAPRTGFGTHSHREFEIFSYVISGALEHEDSLGNTEVLSRGALQMTSTGTGIHHSEKAYGSQEVHFCQIWASPRPGLGTGKPAYFTRYFSDEEKRNQFRLIVAPSNSSEVSLERETGGPAPIRSQLRVYASLMDPGTSLVHAFHPSRSPERRKAYIHVVQKSGYNPGNAAGARLRVGAHIEGPIIELREGDGSYLLVGKNAELKVENAGVGEVEFLLFDME
ncbi:RmlC-like cupin domain-containing protein [Suillus clintonianus]|uniref:RmlC-like cupin domain-containing protein n=1 Tax=Suillus clintonianus TaxID=1904413 RepID=UPI001B86DD0A|nr:RmlC-like cupin domain-containing protein [Suillus clintonianus]KAG2144522.1 RmlC-like cupin domain-containing protein [Suillus clintonianus]